MGTPVIGFDFDECLAQAYTFVPFALFFESYLPRALRQEGVTPATRELLEKASAAFYDNVANAEAASRGTLFRPSLLRLLPRLLSLRQQGRLSHLFLYSNNGTKQVLEAVDHILALTLQKSGGVPATQLLKDEDGRLHVLAPRAYLDEACRAIETKEPNGFREKSLEGISACLGVGLTGEQTYFLDDSRQHVALMKSIGSHYIVVKPYQVKLANKKLAELFIASFPEAAFQPTTREGTIVLSQLQGILPGYRLTGRESPKARLDKLARELGKISPLGSGRGSRVWSEKETAGDFKILETALSGAIQATSVARDVETAAAYRVPIGGGQTRRRKSKSPASRSRMRRGFRTTRSNRR
jgi:hypothetical protein